MFSDTEKEGLKRSLQLVVPSADAAADMFFRNLFELAPERRALFPEDLTGAKQDFIRILAFVVKGFTWQTSDWKADVDPEEDIFLVTLALGRRLSEQYDLGPEFYMKVGQALLSTLRDGLGPSLTPEAERAWSSARVLLTQTLQMGSAAIDREAPLRALDRMVHLGQLALAELEVPSGVDSLPIHTREGTP